MLAESRRTTRIEEGRQLERAAWMAWWEKVERWEERRDEARAAKQPFTARSTAGMTRVMASSQSTM